MSRSIAFPLSLLASFVSGMPLILCINGAELVAGMSKHGDRQEVQPQQVGDRK